MPEAQSIRPLFHSKGKMESLGLNFSSLPPLRAERKKGGEVALLGTFRSSCGFFVNQARDYVPIYRVPSSTEEAALLPLGSYSSYRLLGKMY